MASRAALVQEEASLSLAGQVILSAKEIEADNILFALQAKETIIMGDNFPPAINFFEAHEWITNSSIVFPIIQQMPKGAALHQHLDSTGDYHDLVYNLSHIYPCFSYNGNGEGDYEVGAIDCFDPSYLPLDGPWIPLSTMRAQNPNFDDELLTNLTMQGRDFGDYYQLWYKFDYIFGMIPMLACKEVMADYLARLFFILKRDNIQHAEFREDYFTMHDLQNNNYTWADFIQMFEDTAQASNFSAKLIWAAFRKDPAPIVLADMVEAYQLSLQFPNTLIGFDLDGPEDEGNPLIFYITEFLQIINNTQGGLRFYFHAGESILANNTNLYDALLLNTTRIGHGFQLNKHPLLLEQVISRGICIEVCPISNQILELVQDLRTHPGWEYFNRGMPIAISSDDPSIYGYEGTSYDWYEVFMAWNLDIRGLKQLALNSIKYSTWYNAAQEQQILNQFTQAWNVWIDSIVN